MCLQASERNVVGAEALLLMLLSILKSLKRGLFYRGVAGGYELCAPATGVLIAAGIEATVLHLHCYNMH